MKRTTATVILMIALLMIATLACGGGGSGEGSGNLEGSTPEPGVGNISSPDATATYGAEQFHIQLTAIANFGP